MPHWRSRYRPAVVVPEERDLTRGEHRKQCLRKPGNQGNVAAGMPCASAPCSPNAPALEFG